MPTSSARSNRGRTRNNEQYAYFTVVGEFAPADISARLNLLPTNSWKKGELNPTTKLERKLSRWSLYSELDHSKPLEEHIESVLVQLSAEREKVSRLSSEMDAGIQIVGYFYSDYPGFGLNRETVAQLAELNLSIDCDFYYLYSDKREDSECR